MSISVGEQGVKHFTAAVPKLHNKSFLPLGTDVQYMSYIYTTIHM